MVPAAGRYLAALLNLMLYWPLQLAIQANLWMLAVGAGEVPAVLAARAAPASGNARGGAGWAVRRLWDLPPGRSGGPGELPCP